MTASERCHLSLVDSASLKFKVWVPSLYSRLRILSGTTTDSIRWSCPISKSGWCAPDVDHIFSSLPALVILPAEKVEAWYNT